MTGAPPRSDSSAVAAQLRGFGPVGLLALLFILAGNLLVVPLSAVLVLVWETVFRGFFFERLGKLLGTRPAALVATVLLTSGVFALAHYRDQGLPGVQQAALAGFVFGTIFAVTGQIWLQMVAHAGFVVRAVAWTYWGWESVVAHFLFR